MATVTAATRTKLAQLEPDFARRIEALIVACPHPLGITSGYRSRKRQAELYRLYLAGKGNPANRPGTSKHELEQPPGTPAAEAADLRFGGTRATTVRWVHDNAARFGLHFPIRREDWHCESNGKPFRPLPEDPVTPADIEAIADAVRQELQPAGGAGVGDELDRIRRTLRKIAAATGVVLGPDDV